DKIPSLSDTAKNTGATIADGAGNLADNAGDNVKNAGATVVAAAAGAGAAGATVSATIKKSADTAAASAGQTVAPAATAMSNAVRPGFSIRPAAPNEQRDIVDGNAGSTTTPASADKKSTAANKNQQDCAPKTSKNKTVVASSSGASKEAYKPRLIKERKTRIVSSSQSSSRNSKPVKKATAPAKKSQPKSAPKPAAKSTASKGGYAIQLMATASESRAKKLAKTMKNEGYRSYITRTTRNSKVLFRVRVHAGGNRKSAIASQEKMKRRYQKNFFVQNSLVVSN
ncbi:MAG TPA: SPOR domain-containing protein, partial [Leucothrix sp.]|nr:SPOR domain-containing protein [Leucothrix sp.]